MDVAPVPARVEQIPPESRRLAQVVALMNLVISVLVLGFSTYLMIIGSLYASVHLPTFCYCYGLCIGAMIQAIVQSVGAYKLFTSTNPSKELKDALRLSYFWLLTNVISVIVWVALADFFCSYEYRKFGPKPYIFLLPLIHAVFLATGYSFVINLKRKIEEQQVQSISDRPETNFRTARLAHLPWEWNDVIKATAVVDLLLSAFGIGISLYLIDIYGLFPSLGHGSILLTASLALVQAIVQIIAAVKLHPSTNLDKSLKEDSLYSCAWLGVTVLFFINWSVLTCYIYLELENSLPKVLVIPLPVIRALLLVVISIDIINLHKIKLKIQTSEQQDNSQILTAIAVEEQIDEQSTAPTQEKMQPISVNVQ